MCYGVRIFNKESLVYDSPDIASRPQNFFYDICIKCLGGDPNKFSQNISGSVSTKLRYRDDELKVSYEHATRELIVEKKEYHTSMGERYPEYDRAVRYVAFTIDCSPRGCGSTSLWFDRTPSDLPDNEYYGESEIRVRLS